MIPLLLDSLAAYRITRLITADTILDGPRDALVLRAYARRDGANPKEAPPDGWADFARDNPQAPKLATLVTCRACASVHVAALVVIARRRFPRAWSPIAEALALSAVAALMARLED